MGKVLRKNSLQCLAFLCRLVVGDLQTAYNTLLEYSGENYRCKVVADNAFAEASYSTRVAEIVVIFNLSALTEIGNTKNNLIGVSYRPE